MYRLIGPETHGDRGKGGGIEEAPPSVERGTKKSLQHVFKGLPPPCPWKKRKPAGKLTGFLRRLFAKAAITSAAGGRTIFARHGSFTPLLSKSKTLSRQKMDKAPEQKHARQKDEGDNKSKHYGMHKFSNR